MQKILSSALIMAMVSIGAYAADEMITGGANTCTVDVLGVSADGATANTIAVWSIDKYTLAPGEYLNVTETSVEPAACPPGSYCVGGADFTVDNAATSIATCPTEYPNSRAGAGAQTQCYTACTVATANIAHATAVGGNDYFGDGADACFATDCDTGYHVDGDVEIIERTPLIPVDYTLSGDGYAYIDAGGTSGNSNLTDAGLAENNTWAANFDYGMVYGKASCQPLADNMAIDFMYANYGSVLGGTMTIEMFKAGLEPLTEPLFTDYAVNLLIGVMSGNNEAIILNEAIYTVFGNKQNTNYKITDAGRFCYCQMDSFAQISEAKLEKTNIISAPWVVAEEFGSENICASRCASYCAGSLQSDGVISRAFRAALFGASEAQISGICTANTINIDWNPDNGGEHTKNMCTYDGEVTLPTPDPVKPGYTFTGWKLLEETTTE